MPRLGILLRRSALALCWIGLFAAAEPPAGGPAEPPEAAKGAGWPEAQALKKEAVAILKDMEAASPDPKTRIEKSKAAISKLEEAKRILDALPANKAGDARGEVNALLFWARKMMPISMPTPAETKAPEPKPAEAKAPEPAKPPEPPKPDPEAREKEAEVALMEANLYEERNASDPFMLFVRYQEVADRFQGTRAAAQAHEKVLSALRQMMEEMRKAREELQKAQEEIRKAREPAAIAPPSEPSPPPKPVKRDPPGMITTLPGAQVVQAHANPEPPKPPGAANRFDRVEALACLYPQKNPRLGADVHYLWLQVRFFDGESQVRPIGLRLKALLLQPAQPEPAVLAQNAYALTAEAWTNANHDPAWNCLSHQPALDASVFAKEGYAKRPVHANQDTLYVFVSHFTSIDAAAVKGWRARLEVWDSTGATKRRETPPLPVHALDSTQPDQEKGPADAAPDPDGALATFARGNELLKAGKNDEAEKAFKQALRLFEKAEGAECEHVAACLNRIGSVYGNRRQFPVAEQYIRKAYGMMTRLYGADHPNLIPCLENLAALFDATGRRPDAQKIRSKISDIQARKPAEPPK